MKGIFGFIRKRKGMTYVELLVALSLLALVVVIFTPVLLLSYTKLGNAGEITSKMYGNKTVIEERLAVRDPDYGDTLYPLSVRWANDTLTRFNMNMMKIATDISGLATLYGSPKASVELVSKEEVFDDTSYQDIVLKFTNLSTDDDDMVLGVGLAPSSDLNKVIVSFTTPMLSTTPISIASSSVTDNLLTIRVSGVDVTCSILQVAVYYHDTDGSAQTLMTYVTIKPAHMMFVGLTDASTSYYTSLGVNEGSFVIEGRVMAGVGVDAGKQFNKIRWVDPGLDPLSANGYYAMCGNNGIIRRLWYITDSVYSQIPDATGIGYKKYGEYYKTNWAGDYTEFHTYSVSGTSVSGKNIMTGSRVFRYDTKANTFTKYSGIALSNGDRSQNCIRLSNNLASTVNLDSAIQDGTLFYTYLDQTNGSGGLKRKWKVNWESFDNRSIWDEGYISAPKYSDEIWANYVTGSYNSGFNGNQQPVVFFPKYGGARDNANGGQRYMDSGNQITYVYRMTDNNNGTVWRTISKHWHWFYLGGAEGGYGNTDVGANFTELPPEINATDVKVYGSTARINIDKPYFTAEQNQVLRYIVNALSDGIRVVPAAKTNFNGVTVSPTLDRNNPYVRMKCYTNACTAGPNSNVSVLTRNGFSTDENNAIAATVNDMSNSVDITLTDLCYTAFPQSMANGVNPNMSGSHMLYTGYTPVSALIYAPLPTDAHNAGESGGYINYIVRGTGSASYTVSQFDSSDHPRDTVVLPAVTAQDNNTAFNLGYSSNHTLLYKNEAYTSVYNKAPAEANGLLFPDDFTTYVNYAQDGDATIAVGYKVTGNSSAAYKQIASCNNASHGFGAKPLYVDSAFFYNGSIFKNTNEDMNTPPNADSGNQPFRRGYYLEAGNPNNAQTASGFTLNNTCTCAISYTNLSFAGTNNTQPIQNVGTIALHIGGESAFKTLYTAPSGDFQFTCATLIASGNNYTAYIGDNMGNIYSMTFNSASITATPTLKVNAATTGLSRVNAICATTTHIIAVGVTTAGGTKAVVYENSTNKLESKTIAAAVYKINDLIYNNGIYYAVGCVSATKGVILYTADPFGTWTAVTATNGTELKALYSVAAQSE